MLKNKIKEFNIDITHFTHQLWNKGKSHEDDNRIAISKLTDEDIFINESTKSRKVVREYIIRNKSIPYICDICGSDGEWMGYTISLELDHIDGNPNNNQKNNLRFLCPNCHATTNTYRGKNKTKTIKDDKDIDKKEIDHKSKNIKKYICPICGKNLKTKNAKSCLECYSKSFIIPVEREQLKYEIRNYSFCKVGNMHNVTDNNIRKWCEKYNLPKRRADIKNISDSDWENI